jgi:hypothetical protein
VRGDGDVSALRAGGRGCRCPLVDSSGKGARYLGEGVPVKNRLTDLSACDYKIGGLVV